MFSRSPCWLRRSPRAEHGEAQLLGSTQKLNGIQAPRAAQAEVSSSQTSLSFDSGKKVHHNFLPLRSILKVKNDTFQNPLMFHLMLQCPL